MKIGPLSIYWRGRDVRLFLARWREARKAYLATGAGLVPPLLFTLTGISELSGAAVALFVWLTWRVPNARPANSLDELAKRGVARSLEPRAASSGR
jgi:hypothetical protein